MRKFFVVIFLLSGFGFSTLAQDPEFSQFNAAPLYLNPALAGISNGPRVNLNYRNQWPALDKGYVTYATSFDMHVDKLGGGLGVLFVGDRVANGLLSNYYLSLMYSYHLKLSRKVGLKMGVQGGYIRKHLNWGGLTFSDQINPITGFDDGLGGINPTGETVPNSFNVNMPQVGAGFVVFSPKFYGGLSVRHLTKPKESFINDDDSRLPIRFNIHGGGDFNLTPNQRNNPLILSPNILLTQQSAFTQLNIGTYLYTKYIFGGVWFRHTFSNSDAVIGVLGVRVSYVRVGYSYDYTVSGLQNLSGGAHEISIGLNFGDDGSSPGTRKGRGGAIECPSFLKF